MPWYEKKANKYGARKTVFDNRKYDSKGEAGLAQELSLLQKAGEIRKIEPQRTFPLYGRGGARVCNHRVDFFVTFKDGSQEVFEYKGFATDTWRIKRDLFVDNYPEYKYNVITAKGNYYKKH
jgi:hypothetical protein